MADRLTLVSSKPEVLRGKPVVLPALSTGAAERLAIDLMAVQPDFERVGWLHTNLVLPVTGSDALGKGSQLSFPIEVYSNASINLVQVRSLVAQGEGHDFVSSVCAWAESIEAPYLIILATTRSDAKRLSSDPAVFKISNSPNLPVLSEVHSETLDSYGDFLGRFGLAKRFLKKSPLPTGALFVYSGDSEFDVVGAELLADAASRSFGLSVQAGLRPPYWASLVDY
jgi:predicted ATP-grasp superfamily ATP-dependent carboligase